MNEAIKEVLLDDEVLYEDAYADDITEESSIPMVTRQAIEEKAEILLKYWNLWISYPDLFVDFITLKESHFSLFFYQRIVLRACFRYRYVYVTATRAFSKSFLQVLALYIRCILLPNSHLFICAETKEQAVKIAVEQLTKIWGFVPLLRNEILPPGRGSSIAKENVQLNFKNGSILDVVTPIDSTRGGRRTGGSIEEVILHNATHLSEIVIPLMNVPRAHGSKTSLPGENNRLQIYVTTAGMKSSFAYDKLIEVMTREIIDPKTAFVFGSSYKIPLVHGLFERDMIIDMKMDSTFSEESFAREYMSVWTGGSESSFFKFDKLTAHRRIVNVEHRYNKNVGKGFYVIMVDIARSGKKTADETAIIVMKVMIHDSYFKKKIVNLFTLKGMPFTEQACIIKETAARFRSDNIVIDAQTLGSAIMDEMVKENVSKGGQVYPAFGIRNYNDFKDDYPDLNRALPPKVYGIKTNQHNVSDIHANCLIQIQQGRVDFLINEGLAKDKLNSTKKGQKMKSLQKIEFLAPYQWTSRLIDQVTNLRNKSQSIQSITLEQINKNIHKDLFSALEYGLFYIKTILEDSYYSKLKRSRKRASDSVFITKGKGGHTRHGRFG